MKSHWDINFRLINPIGYVIYKIRIHRIVKHLRTYQTEFNTQVELDLLDSDGSEKASIEYKWVYILMEELSMFCQLGTKMEREEFEMIKQYYGLTPRMAEYFEKLLTVAWLKGW